MQGVGFRPFVYRLALEHGLTGRTRNAPEGVVVEIQGTPAAVDAFCESLIPKAPPLARITHQTQAETPIIPGENSFAIEPSAKGSGHAVLISPDVATCDDCLAELQDPNDFRHAYPFINCTNCGPRYTITRDIPYDRKATTMACFTLCALCQAEYENPANRRFHAQPNACHACGPHVWLQDADGNVVARHDAAMRQAARAISEGKLLAMKGLGGFQLVCDANNRNAIAHLRGKKHRPHKPLAVMAADLAAARHYVSATEAEARLLTTPERPIVLCSAAPTYDNAAHLSPDTKSLGIMLPYTPMQHTLLKYLQENTSTALPPLLVMTSGNHGGEPICLGNREALQTLGALADLFLLHNRDILIRVDDSVVRIPAMQRNPGAPSPSPGSCDSKAIATSSQSPGLQFLRRARGYTPSPIALAGGGPCVLGTGPELKATLCCTKGSEAFVSQHLGDLNNLETFAFFEEIENHLPKLLRVAPVAIVHDLHPDFMTTRWAQEQAASRDIPAFSLQHHAAHAFSVLAENGFQGRALVLALDGTGLGLPRSLNNLESNENSTPHVPIWGGEAILVDMRPEAGGEWKRVGHLRPVPLPGGEAAAREPWRMAMSYGRELGLHSPEALGMALPEALHPAAAFLPQILQTGLNAPLTSSCGRLFDAIASLLGLCHTVTYEGQAAIRLEQSQDQSFDHGDIQATHIIKRNSTWQLDTVSLFNSAASDIRNAIPVGTIARRFHLGLVQGLAEFAAALAAREGVTHVGLSGGCMLNQTLHTELPAALCARGLTPLLHRQLPPGDACVSLGQAVWGQLHMGSST